MECDIVLNVKNKGRVVLENYGFDTVPEVGDILMWNDAQYIIKEVIYHQKPGVEPYIELIPTDKSSQKLPRIYSFGDKKDSKHFCMYCGKEGYGNPSDWGLHYSDVDVYGTKYVCPLCDQMITQTNRMLKSVLSKVEEGDITDARRYLDMASANLQRIKSLI